jgi:hypothetical protein
MKLRCTKQCKKCPWKVKVNPNDIPNGYSLEKHRALASTIADSSDPLGQLSSDEIRVMACHETDSDYCVGWLHNQLGVGNNIGLRLDILPPLNLRF